MSMPPSPSSTPTTRRTRPRPGRRPSGSTRCWCSWTAPRSPAGRRWPGCCGRATPAPTPPPTTSPCCDLALGSRCRRRLPTAARMTRPGHRSWSAPTPPAPPTRSPPPAATAGVGFSFGFPVDCRVRDAVETLTDADCWYPAIESDGDLRDGAWVAEATDLVDLSELAGRDPADPAQGTPASRRAAALHRLPTGCGSPRSSPTPPTVSCPASSPGWSCATANTPASRTGSAKPRPPGCATCPVTASDANAAWLEIVLTAIDLVAWTKLIGFTDHPELARCEIATFRYRVLHVAARITRSARQTRLRIDATWRWATAIAKPGNDSAPPSPDHPTHRPTRPEGPHRPWKARPPSDTGRPVIPTRHNQPHKPASTGSAPPRARPHEKSRLNAVPQIQ